MFESLTDKLSRSLRNLRGVGKLSEENVSDALAEVRKALLSADVHFRTAREFVEEVKRACMGQEVLKSVSPGQQVIKIIHDELVKLLGEGSTSLRDDRPLRVLIVLELERVLVGLALLDPISLPGAHLSSQQQQPPRHRSNEL